MNAPFSCDGILRNPQHLWFRAIDVAAAPHQVFPWLMQLRVAPYSYDWIDNFGRQSPTVLAKPLPPLAEGQRAMHVFTVVSFATDRQLTLRLRQPWWIALWADMALTYRLETNENGCRIVVKMFTLYPATPFGWIARLCLPTGDWIMMRKQLRTIRKLAEETKEIDVCRKKKRFVSEPVK